jgi:hypothetical protein
METLANIRIGDTAAGSGGFLIKVLRAIWSQYLRIDEASSWAGACFPRRLRNKIFD